jgi:hypothetical protein
MNTRNYVPNYVFRSVVKWGLKGIKNRTQGKNRTMKMPHTLLKNLPNDKKYRRYVKVSVR